MFNLVKKIDGQYNTPGDPHVVKVTALGSNTSYKAGTPVNIGVYTSGGTTTYGVVTPMANDSTFLATHIIVEDTAKNATEIKVIDILPDMVFETVIVGQNADTNHVCSIGSEVKIDGTSEYGVLPTLTGPKWTGTVASTTATIASGIRGCIIYATPESTAVGTKVLVKFPVA